MGKSSKPPDYVAQTKAQGEANKDAALYNNNANRVDQYTPLGSSTWVLRPGADPRNPQPGDYIQSIALSPEQQGLYNTGMATSNTLAGAQDSAAQRVASAMGQAPNFAGLPGLMGAPGIVQTAQAGQGINGVAPTPGALTQDFSADRDRTVQALMSRIAPDQAAARARMDTGLANRGIDLGSTAYQRANDLQGRQENDARMSAQLAGGQEQARLQALAMQAQGQQFNQGLAGAQFGNQAQAQQFGQQAQQDQLINALLGRNAAFNNQSRTQGIEEEAYRRSLPFNELASLRSGSAVAMPNFGSYYSSGTQPAPIMDAAIAQGNANSAANGQAQSGINAALGGAASLAGATSSSWLPALMAMFSDARLKTNIRTIGAHPSGVRRVSWDWIFGGSSSGVIAQELASVRPDAVLHLGPYLGVDYDLIGGR